jgi:hypothetical protein
MGRVSKYTKIKSCDPYSKKNGGNIDLSTVGIWGLGDNGRKKKKRSRTAERLKAANKKYKNRKGVGEIIDGFDLPPTEKDEFDMADLMGSVKKQKMDNELMVGELSTAIPKTVVASTSEASYNNVVTSTGNVANIPVTEHDEKKVARLLKLESQVEAKEDEKKQETYKRMEGESKRAYAKRTKAETRQIIKQTTTTKNLEKLKRKKEFLKNKKNKKKRGGGSSAYQDSNNNDGNDLFYDDHDTKTDDLVTGERAVAAMGDPVRFGEQAERPPVFRQLPRGADKLSKRCIGGGTAISETTTSKRMTEAQIEAESYAMEMMRRRLQAQYAVIKSKRRQAGEFHL